MLVEAEPMQVLQCSVASLLVYVTYNTAFNHVSIIRLGDLCSRSIFLACNHAGFSAMLESVQHPKADRHSGLSSQ